MIVISIDLNGLKDINDSNGHMAGDLALQQLGTAMKVKSGKNFLTYRVGGDEFMELGKEQSIENATTYIEEMRHHLKSNQIMASFGYALYQPGDHFDTICNQADACMYEDKKQYKHRTISRKNNIF